MGISAFAPLLGGLLQGGASLWSGISKANAADSAAQTQANSAQQGINAIQGTQQQQQQNASPYMTAGSTSLGMLMQALQGGTFGPGSSGPVPQFNESFTAPTMADAMQSPGYQFTAQQGNKGILQGAAAAGGAISGGTLKALDSYNTGLANNTYGDVFNRALTGYNASLAKHNAQLQDYSAGLQGKQQEYNQLMGPAGLGLNATNSLNSALVTDAHSIADLFTQQGNARAAGIVGSTNNLWGGVQSGIGQMTGTNGSNISSIADLFSGGVSNGSATAPSSMAGLNLGSLFPGASGPGPAPYVPPPPSSGVQAANRPG